MIKIVIVDEHNLVRSGLCQLFEKIHNMEVAADFSTGQAAVSYCRNNIPDVVLLEIKMSGIGGLEIVRRIHRSHSEIKIIGVSQLNHKVYPMNLIKLGAMGYVTKFSDFDELVTAIEMVMEGEHYLSSDIVQQIALNGLKTEVENPFDLLSEREMQVALMLVDGKKVNTIADDLSLSPKTINGYRYRIFEKTGINSDVKLVYLALKYQVVDRVR